MTMLNEAIIKHFEDQLSLSSEHTRKSRLFYCKMFLSFAGDRTFSEWNKTLVSEFLAELKRDGYSPGTISVVYGIVKRVFDSAKAVHEAERMRQISEVEPTDQTAVAQLIKAMSLPGPNWDMGKRSAPKVQSRDMLRPSRNLDEMAAMVLVAKPVPAEAVYIALASIYGLRLGELLRVRAEHIDLRQKTIFVSTEKGGEQRDQLLCDEILPYLENYDFSVAYSPFTLSQLYYRIEAKAGLQHQEGGCWHTLRRALDTELVDACNQLGNTPGELYAHFFLRWRLSGSMVERYYSRSPLEIDAKVLSVHPVIPMWR